MDVLAGREERLAVQSPSARHRRREQFQVHMPPQPGGLGQVRVLDRRRGRRHHHHDPAAILPDGDRELLIELARDGQQPDPRPVEARLLHHDACRLSGRTGDCG